VVVVVVLGPLAQMRMSAATLLQEVVELELPR
jgi:hypothetical protein